MKHSSWNSTYAHGVMGLLLLVVGVMLLTGAFSAFSYWLLETFPGLATLG